MSAFSPLKINDRLVSFAAQSQSDQLANSLEKLAVFHEEFSADIQAHNSGDFDLNSGKTYEDGLAEGLAQGQRAAQDQGQDTQQLIAALRESLQALGHDIEASHGRAVAGVLRGVLPNLAEKAIGAEVRAFLSQISGQALRGAVTLLVNPAFEKELDVILHDIGKGHFDALEFTLQADESLSGRALKAVWQGGGGEIDIEAAVQSCLALLDDQET